MMMSGCRETANLANASYTMKKAAEDIKTYKTKDICALYDISRATLFRWETEGFITGVGRDWRGWRIYSKKNLQEIERIIKGKQ